MTDLGIYGGNYLWNQYGMPKLPYISEFNIAKPTYLGVGVQDQIRIKIAMTVTSVTTTARNQ